MLAPTSSKIMTGQGRGLPRRTLGSSLPAFTDDGWIFTCADQRKTPSSANTSTCFGIRRESALMCAFNYVGHWKIWVLDRCKPRPHLFLLGCQDGGAPPLLPARRVLAQQPAHLHNGQCAWAQLSRPAECTATQGGSRLTKLPSFAGPLANPVVLPTCTLACNCSNMERC